LKVPRSRDDHEHLAQGAGRHRVGGRVDAQLLAVEHVEEVVGVEVVGGVHGIRRPPEHGLLQVEDAVPLGRFGDLEVDAVGQLVVVAPHVADEPEAPEYHRAATLFDRHGRSCDVCR